MSCQAAMCTMQSQPRNASYSFSRSRMDPWINTSPFESPGERRSKITGTSPLLTNRGTRVCPRSPDPPVRSTLMVFSLTYLHRLKHSRSDGSSAVAPSLHLQSRSVVGGERWHSRRGCLHLYKATGFRQAL